MKSVLSIFFLPIIFNLGFAQVINDRDKAWDYYFDGNHYPSIKLAKSLLKKEKDCKVKEDLYYLIATNYEIIDKAQKAIRYYKKQERCINKKDSLKLGEVYMRIYESFAELNQNNKYLKYLAKSARMFPSKIRPTGGFGETNAEKVYKRYITYLTYQKKDYQSALMWLQKLNDIPLESGFHGGYKQKVYRDHFSAKILSESNEVDSAISIVYKYLFNVPLQNYHKRTLLAMKIDTNALVLKDPCLSSHSKILLKKHSKQFLNQEFKKGIESYAYTELEEIDSLKDGRYRLNLLHKASFAFLSDSTILERKINQVYDNKAKLELEILLLNKEVSKPNELLNAVKNSNLYKCVMH